MPQEPALLTSGAMDGGAKSASSERRLWRAVASVRRRGAGSPLAAHHIQPAATLTGTRLHDLLDRAARKLKHLDVGTGLGLRPGRQGDESIGHREADHV